MYIALFLSDTRYQWEMILLSKIISVAKTVHILETAKQIAQHIVKTARLIAGAAAVIVVALGKLIHVIEEAEEPGLVVLRMVPVTSYQGSAVPHQHLRDQAA